MKKKIIALVVALLMIIGTAAGCGIIEIDPEKDLDQVVARVGDPNGYRDEITKKDLLNAYYQTGSYYQQYGYAVKDIVDMLLEQLVNNRLIMQEAVRTIAQEQGFGPLASGTTADIAFYLTPNNKFAGDELKSERMRKLVKFDVDEKAYWSAVNSANKYLIDVLDSYEEKVKADWPDDEDEEEDKEDERPVREPVSPVEEKYEKQDKAYLDNPENEVAKTRKEAYKRLTDALAKDRKLPAGEAFDQFYEDMLVSYLENQVMDIYDKILQRQIVISKDAMKERFDNELANVREQYYVNVLDYIQVRENATDSSLLYYDPLGGYGYVMNLLIGFDDELKLKLDANTELGFGKDIYLSKRTELLNDISVKYLYKEGEKGYASGSPEWLSKNYTKPDTAINAFLNEKILPSLCPGMPEVVIDEFDKEYYVHPDFCRYFKSAYKMGAITKEQFHNAVYGKGIIGTEGYEKGFMDYIYDYGTDPGMFDNVMGYLSKPQVPKGERETYVDEFAKAARWCVNEGEGSFALVGTDFGWHLILCVTDVKISDPDNAGFDPYTDEAVAKIVGLIENDKISFKDIPWYIQNRLGEDPFLLTSTFSYKFYKFMFDEISNNVYSEKARELKAHADANDWITINRKIVDDMLKK